MWHAERLSQLPPYLFVEIDRKKRAAIEAGRDVIDFGVGDPDQPTHKFIVDRMAEAIRTPSNHRYALGVGSMAFRKAVAAFFVKRFGVDLDPASEIVALLGSKEAIGHLPTAVINPGESVLVPEPGYPVYTAGTIFAGGKCHCMPLSEKNGWLPRLDEIPAEVRRAAKLMYLNYPNNPTAACAPRSFFEEAVAFAREYGILIAQDAAYSEVYFDEKVKPPSILEIPGAKDVAIELHSLSKTFNMTGWRIGFAVGNKDALAALAKVKSNCDSGVFGAVQETAIAALAGVSRPEIKEQLRSYQRRRDILVTALQKAGWSIESPQATFYVWARPPIGALPPINAGAPISMGPPISTASGSERTAASARAVSPLAKGGLRGVGGDARAAAAACDSMAVASRILEEVSVVVIPGIGFGKSGEGYIRFALTVDEARTQEAANRLSRLTW